MTSSSNCYLGTPAAVTAAASFTNAGTIEPACGGSTTLTLAKGTLTNTGNIYSVGNYTTVSIQAKVNNQGTLYAAGNDTLNVSSLTNYSSSTQTLTGGSYVIQGNIDVPGMTVATNAATIDFGGGSLVNGSSNALQSLSINSGTLGLIGGTGWGSPGPLTSSGTIILNGGQLTVNGAFTQTSSGILETEVLSASEAGNLNVRGKASLAGTLALSRASAYTPSSGDSQQVVSCTSRAGHFNFLSGTAAGTNLAFVVSYSPSSVLLTVKPVI
jgi:hypothetical protein